MKGKKTRPKNKNKKLIKKRDRVAYPGLDKSVNARTRRDLLDYDYINKLSPEDKAYLNRFSNEFVAASFQKTKGGNYSSKNLHKTAKARRECYSNNNSRNRCELTLAQASGMAQSLTDNDLEGKQSVNYNSTEDALIDILDAAASGIVYEDDET